MAALDFPNAPTTNQQYAAPNGVTYQWDGAAWVVTGGPPGQLWTGAGPTLTPTDTTKRVVVPGPSASGADQSNVVIGGGAIKTRLATQVSADYGTFSINRYYNGTAWQRDNTAWPAWTLALDDVNDGWSVIRMSAAGATTTPFAMDNAGNLTILGPTATKASGTTWANPSDPRLKEDIAPYARGLADVVQLDPITYRLKADPTGATCYGFDAAAVEPIFPECVTETSMKLSPDDAEPTDGVLSFDMHPIVVALVNAVKELTARVAALETSAPAHA